MDALHIFAISALILFASFYITFPKRTQITSDWPAFLLFGSALLLRILLSAYTPGHETDISCFAAWAERIYSVGPGSFYSTEVFTDYPPGYMYILYIIGALRSLLQLPYYSELHLLLLKFPAVICDIFAAALLYREANHRYSRYHALLTAAVYLFNPAIILNSSVWGQVDSLYSLFVLCMCIALMKGKFFPACIFFGIGTLIKPQMIIFTPLLLVHLADSVFLRRTSPKYLLTEIGKGILAALTTVLAALPFGLDKVIPQYVDTMTSYTYATVNAYNFWGLFGLNWQSQDSIFLFLPVRIWGNITVILLILFTALISIRMGLNKNKYALIGSFLILSMFVFSTRMHERYLFPCFLLLLLSFLQHPDKKLVLCYGGFSLLNFYNTAHVLYCYDPYAYDPKAPMIFMVSAGTVACIIFFYHTLKGLCSNTQSPADFFATKSSQTFAFKPFKWDSETFTPVASASATKFTRTDCILLLIITCLYSMFALHDLGYRQAPETVHTLSRGESIILEFESKDNPESLSYYIAPDHARTYQLELTGENDESMITLSDLTFDSVFTWQTLSLHDAIARSAQDDTGIPTEFHRIKLILTCDNASVLELVFTDHEGNILTPVNSNDYPALFDESHCYPSNSSYRDSMYFDEIYHARSAYEFLEGQTTYENTHPPLGKILIALGVAILGMNPFGWRIVGTLIGIFMLPVFYLFTKKITKNSACAAFGTFLFAFDFMHFTQTRIATIDVYAVFFILLMYYFMFQYCHLSFYDTSLRKTFIPLGACGICMGLGIACKWTCAYAGVGLGILFFAILFQRYREYVWAKSRTVHTPTVRAIISGYPGYARKTIGFCMIFFVAIPFMIYLLSYLPFRDGSDAGLLTRMIRNQETMFSYHSTLDATHAFSSSWKEWPIMIRPVWYYSNIVSDTATTHIREGISAFGNPLIWWAGIPAFIYMVCLATKKKDRTAAFLMIGYLAQYLPWFFVTRITFIYHYFPSVIFVVLMISHSMMQLKNRLSRKQFVLLLLLYVACVFGMFLLFYPVLSGQPVSTEYVDTYLRWFDSWVLVAG